LIKPNCLTLCGMWYAVCGMWYAVCGMWYVVCGMLTRVLKWDKPLVQRVHQMEYIAWNQFNIWQFKLRVHSIEQ